MKAFDGSENPTLDLTEQEEILCQLLHDTCAWIQSTRPALPEEEASTSAETPLQATGWKCEARIAGGWVRDKLLSSGSNDLDVSLSTLTGYHFALYLKAYLSSEDFTRSELAQRSHSSSDSSGAPEWSLSSIGKIGANPEQSKSLETARAKVLGLDVDFVNLRKEVYETESRIPIMMFGTPTEDAERRDITINTMFYNVHTRRIEDFTGKGLADLQDGLVRTPLPPLTTFLDDPLRILRCVRFASRFGYRLDTSIRTCLASVAESADLSIADLAEAKDPRLHQMSLQRARELLRKALHTKVSRERFGIEVDKMLNGPDPLYALNLLIELDLFTLVFRPLPSAEPFYTFPEGFTLKTVATSWVTSPEAKDMVEGSPGESSVSLHAAEALLECMAQAGVEREALYEQPFKHLTETQRQELSAIPRDLLQVLHAGEQRRRLFYGAALLPLRHLMSTEKKRLAWVGENVILEGLKLSGGTKDALVCLYAAADLLSILGDSVLPNGSEPPLPHLWPATATEAARLLLFLRRPSITNPQLELSVRTAFLFTWLSLLVNRWNGVQQDGTSLESLSHAWSLLTQINGEARLAEKARLNGNEIKEVLGFAPANMTPRIQTAILAWQFDRPLDQGSQEECKAWLKAQWEGGGIIPPEERVIPKSKTKVKGK